MATAAPYDRNAFRICVAQAVRDGVQALKKALAETEAALSRDQDTARDNRERDRLGEALALLRAQQSTLVQAYPVALMEHFSGAQMVSPPAPGASAHQALAGGPIAWDALTLMDDAQVLAQVELSRAQQLVTHATEGVLEDLDRLMSAALGLTRVAPERNPLRPETFLRALQQVVADAGVAEGPRQLWMRHLPDLLGKRLVGAYQRASDRLREGGLRPVGYGAAPAAGRPATAPRTGLDSLPEWQGYPAPQRGPGAHAYTHTHAHAHAAAATHERSGFGASALQGMPSSVASPLAAEAEEALLTVAMLQQMLDELSAARTPATGFASGATEEGLLAAALPDGAVQAPDTLARHGPAALPASGAPAWQAPPSLMTIDADIIAHQQAESDAVVAEMMRRIASDERLLPTVRRALQRIEPAIRRIARQEPAFFSDEQHPARRLLDALTERSLAFTADDQPGFTRFVRLLNGAVKHLNAANAPDAKPFKAVLRALHKAWDALAQESAAQRAQADADWLHLERKAVLARAAADDIRRMPGARDLPADLLAFATGPWAEVVARAQTGDAGEGGGGDPSEYLALIPVLLSCAQADPVPEDPDAMARAIAGLLPVVREGLQGIGHPQPDIDAVLERLAGLVPVGGQATAPAAAASDTPIVFPPEAFSDIAAPALPVPALPAAVPAAAPASQGGEPVIEPAAHGSDAEPVARAPYGPEVSVPEPGAEAPAPQGPGDYALGQWIELSRDRQVVRTQLTWCSPNGALFLFTAADGSTQSMTRRMRDRLVAQGALRTVETPPSPR